MFVFDAVAGKSVADLMWPPAIPFGGGQQAVDSWVEWLGAPKPLGESVTLSTAQTPPGSHRALQRPIFFLKKKQFNSYCGKKKRAPNSSMDGGPPPLSA